MPFNFPDPAVSTTATNPVTGAKYQWKADPGKWVLTGGPGDAPNPPVTISLLPPEGPQKGDLWIHEESLIEYAWDGTQWFEVGSSCGGGNDEEEEEENEMYPFVNSFRLVAPDDFKDEDGTATIRTPAYLAGADWYLSPFIEDITFAFRDLNGRRHEQAVEGDTIHIAPKTKAENDSGYLYAAFEVTNVMSNGMKILYEGDYDSSRSVIWTEGDTIYYRIAPAEETPYQPFVTRYKLVDPDDYTGEDGTATVKTVAYLNGSNNFFSPDVIEVKLAALDLDERYHESLVAGELFDLAPQTLSSNNKPFGTYLVNQQIGVNDYTVESKTMVLFTEGDIVYFRKTSSDLYVRKEGGDTMEGPLVISGPRKAGDDPDQPKWESTINVLNVDNRLGSYLGLKHNGNTKVYVGGDSVSIASDIKFNRNQGSFISSNVQEVLKVNDRNVAYLGQIIEEDSLVTKEYVDTTDEELRQDILELEQEIDAIAPSVERGEWLYSDTGIPNAAGSYSMNTDTFDAGLGDPADIFAAVENIVINERDQSGTIHSFANAEAGQLIEIFEASDADYGLYEILDVTQQTGGGTGPTPAYTYWSIDVSLVRTGQGDKASGVARFKIFSPPSGGTADGFVLKSGDTMTGDLEILRKPEDDDKKPFMIQGKYTNGDKYSMFYAYRGADGNGDGVAYYGKQPDSENSAHIATTGFVVKKVNALLAKIEELEMSTRTPTSYSFRMYTKRYGSSSSIGQYMSKNEICSNEDTGSSWSARDTYGLQAEKKYIYVCFEDGYQLNSTGYMQVIKSLNDTGYDRTGKSATFAISEVEVAPPDKANGKNIYRAVVQIDALKESTQILPSWSDGDYLHITFTGGSVTKVS